MMRGTPCIQQLAIGSLLGFACSARWFAAYLAFAAGSRGGSLPSVVLRTRIGVAMAHLPVKLGVPASGRSAAGKNDHESESAALTPPANIAAVTASNTDLNTPGLNTRVI